MALVLIGGCVGVAMMFVGVGSYWRLHWHRLVLVGGCVGIAMMFIVVLIGGCIGIDWFLLAAVLA